MKHHVVNKVYFLSVIKNDKVVEILTGKCLDFLQHKVQRKYKDCVTQIMEYNDEYDIYVPDIEEQLMMIRRRQQSNTFL